MRKTVCALLALAVAVTVAGGPSAEARVAPAPIQADPPSRELTWLDFGDSYGAGEGASGTTGRCQRSPNAAGPKAATILRSERGWRIKANVFSACTGFWAADAYSSRAELQESSITLHHNPDPPGPANPPGELANEQSLEDWANAQGAQGKKFDVVTISMSGNDIGFADVVVGCLDLVRRLGGGGGSVAPSTGSSWETFVRGAALDALDKKGCGPVVGELDDRVASLFTGDPYPQAGPSVDGGRGSVVDVYRSIADEYLADEGVLVVMGYPRLIVPSEDWGRWRGGQCNLISAADADRLGQAAETFDERMRAAVEGLGDSRIAYVSRLEVFDDGDNYHSLCGRGVEWINTALLFLRDGTLRKERGFHPNDLGYLATAEQVAGLVESHLGELPAPPATSATTPTTPGTVRSSESHFDIGEPFGSRCVIAWPTAPTRSTTSIQMRTSCTGVPKQFLFVDIIYDDPDLDVSPNRARMDVEGEIIDIARSEFGYTTLVVYAHSIDVL